MSITPNSLRNKRKNELKEIATDLGLNTKGLRSELEERIRIHLEGPDNIKTEEGKLDATSSKTSPRRSVRKRTISNTKVKTRVTSALNGDRHSSDEENQSVSSGSESKQDIIITQTEADLEITETIIPSDNFFNNVQGSLIQLRNDISNSKTFCKTITFLELLVFLYSAIEWNYKIASIPFPSFDSEESYNYDVHIPDIFILIEWHRFWRPLISFIFYLLLIPLILSYIFNFEPQRHSYSPLTFSVSQYAIFMVSNFDWVYDVRDFIPDNLIYVGAGTGAIFALYESILANV